MVEPGLQHTHLPCLVSVMLAGILRLISTMHKAVSPESHILSKSSNLGPGLTKLILALQALRQEQAAVFLAAQA